jgi:UDP-N-acetylglucosamine--N-acetylmuramyl-(pentapeptide) pyrophosphoryl-undecaprenol N-acetylglucosamine transferase
VAGGRAWAVIAGGGTGGHVYPGVALAAELVRRGHDPLSVRFVGARRGVEAKSQALAGFPATFLPGRGLARSFSLEAAFCNLRALAGTSAAMARTFALFARWRPAVVVSLGGYASLPCVVAAALYAVPVVVVDLDAVPGLVNRWAARLPRSSVYKGVPVRPDVANVDRSPDARLQAKHRLGLPGSAVVVAVSGGSLGSLRLNRAASELVELWAERQDLAVYHVVGWRDWASFARPVVAGRGLSYRAVPYQEDMATLYSAADVAVQRAGASAVAELALAGLPSLLVPLPGAPGGHQAANAQAMEAAGAAVVVPDSELDGERLAKELDSLIADRGRLESMASAAKSLARAEAAEELADLVERAALRPPAGEPRKAVAGAG